MVRSVELKSPDIMSAKSGPPSGVIDLAQKRLETPIDRAVCQYIQVRITPKEIIGIFREPRILLAHHPY